MGCNYYLERKPCSECGASGSEHIGKLSGGHPFLFHGTERENSWYLWNNRIEREVRVIGAVVKDEYGRTMRLRDLEDIVDKSYAGYTMRPNRLNDNGYEWTDEAGYHFLDGEFS